MRTPRLGINWRLSLFDVRVADTIQTNSDTQTDVLGFKVYSRTPEIVQGGIRNVTGRHSIPGEGLPAMASKCPALGAEHLISGKNAAAKPVLGEGTSLLVPQTADF